MKRLKTILLYNASKYIHLSILVTLALFTKTQPWLIMVVFAYGLFLYKHSKSLLMIGLLLLVIIGVRQIIMDKTQVQNLPIQASIIKVDDDKIQLKNKDSYWLYMDDTSPYKPGMMIYIKGQYADYDIKHMPHVFNFHTYMKSKKIKAIIEPSEITILKEKKHINLIAYHTKAYIDQNFDHLTASYLKLFILGDKEGLDQDIYKQSQSIGISHLFAISGMHLGIIILVINGFLKLFYMRRSTHLLLLAMVLLVYNILTGFSISIVRTTLLYICLFMSQKSNYRLSRTDYLSFIFIGFLIYNPYVIFDLGFQLSFLITCSILLFSSRILNKSRIIQVLYISFIANIFSLPIILSLNKEIGLLNIGFNIIFIVYIGFLVLPFSFILLMMPYLQAIYGLCIKSLEKLIDLANQVNIYVSYSFSQPILVFLYYLLLMMSLSIRWKKMITIIELWIFFLIINISSLNYHPTKVTVLDVNQGDAILFQSQGCKMLLDTGYSDDYDSLIHYLKGENIDKLNAMILSHNHTDHVGEYKDIINSLEVAKIYSNYDFIPSDLIENVILEKNDAFFCGHMHFRVLNAYDPNKSENNNSMVLYMKVKGDTWLFTGDIESSVEQDLLEDYNMHINHLKIAHHGSETSSTQSFIDRFNPKNAYISVGNNTFGHPNDQVIERLAMNETKIFLTKNHGTIDVIYQFNRVYRRFYFDGRYYYDIF